MSDTRSSSPSLPTYYLLRIYVNETDNLGLRAKYENARDAHNTSVLPYLQGLNTSFDAGFDLFIPNESTILAGTYSNKIPHGIFCEMLRVETKVGSGSQSGSGSGSGSQSGSRAGSVGGADKFETRRNVGFYLYVRSSTGAKTPLRLSNHVGIIDAPYRGEIMALFDNVNLNGNEVCSKHQRLIQICAPDLSYPIVVELVNSKSELSLTSRGEGGLGSTGQ